MLKSALFIYLDDAQITGKKLSVDVEHIMQSTVTDLIIAKGTGYQTQIMNEK